jgi:NagD protein
MGKPSAWIMRAALNRIDAHSENTIIVGDNLNTDILAGIQAGLETVLVLTGVSRREDIHTVAWRPHHVFDNAGEIDVV